MLDLVTASPRPAPSPPVDEHMSMIQHFEARQRQAKDMSRCLLEAVSRMLPFAQPRTLNLAQVLRQEMIRLGVMTWSLCTSLPDPGSGVQARQLAAFTGQVVRDVITNLCDDRPVPMRIAYGQRHFEDLLENSLRGLGSEIKGLPTSFDDDLRWCQAWSAWSTHWRSEDSPFEAELNAYFESLERAGWQPVDHLERYRAHLLEIFLQAFELVNKLRFVRTKYSFSSREQLQNAWDLERCGQRLETCRCVVPALIVDEGGGSWVTIFEGSGVRCGANQRVVSECVT